MNDIELAWAAGLFEGEGTVRINKPTKRNAGHLVASVVNTDRQITDYFQSRWPGYMQKASGLDPTRQREAWVWNVAARKVAAFLAAIMPFVVRDAVLERIAHGLTFQAGKRSSHEARTLEYIEQQWNAYWWMCELNTRGVRKEPLPLRPWNRDRMLTCIDADKWRNK